MHTGNSIIIQAPKMTIFETASNLELWPRILPHYRYIRYLERADDRNLVVMAAVRSGIPISWTSEQVIDRKNVEVHFHHLKAWTKGMHVVWTSGTACLPRSPNRSSEVSSSTISPARRSTA
jgi:uncharacterized membrane protein